MKRIVLGITGSIAAYKSADIANGLVKLGWDVHAVMTKAGAAFITPLTLQALTKNRVFTDVLQEDDPSEIVHVNLPQRSDMLLIAPATANTINKLAWGIADNLLTTTALATEAPLIIAPAMNVHMWRDETTQESLALLRRRGAQIVEPEAGYLACGEVGEGRLAAVEEIATSVLNVLRRSRDLAGKTLLVTAGPTREYLDPVRFLSNASSGATGYAIAEEAARRGAEVVLVSGPSTLPDPFGCTTIRVTSAQEMYEAAASIWGQGDSSFCPPLETGDKTNHPLVPSAASVWRQTNRSPVPSAASAFTGLDAAIFTAAVADYRPATCEQHKAKKAALGSTHMVEFTQNPDILATLAAAKGSTFVVGFAAESQNIIEAAQKKLAEKNADLIVANDISDPSLGFASTHNRWFFVTPEDVQTTDVLPKKALASLLLDKVAEKLQ